MILDLLGSGAVLAFLPRMLRCKVVQRGQILSEYLVLLLGFILVYFVSQETLFKRLARDTQDRFNRSHRAMQLAAP